MREINEGETHFRVLIVGCGNIAGGFDQARSTEDLPYTHAGAFTRDGRFSIAACIEPDDMRRGQFMDEWGVPLGFSSFDNLIASGEKFDVISICSPTTCHTDDLETALLLKPRLVFCEKPITESLADTKRIVAEYQKASIPLMVNYTRRWDPDISMLQSDLQESRRGTLRSVTGTYNKGLLNNGSHMLDLLHLIVGPMKIVRVGEPIHDFSPNDPTVPVWLEGEQGVPVYLACGHAEDYAIFELQLIFSQGVLIMENGGLYWRDRPASESGEFKGYRLLEEGVRRAGKYPHAMLQAVDNIYRSVKHGEPLGSTGESALSVQQVCEEIKQHIQML